jgi:glycosidase
MPDVPVFELHIARTARERYRCADSLFTLTGNALFANLAATRALAARMTEARAPEHAIHPGALYAMGLIDEALHAVIGLYREQRDPNALSDALAWFERRLGREALDQTLARFVSEFPPLVVHRGEQAPDTWLATTTGGVPHRAVALEELILLWLTNGNRAFRPAHELFDDASLVRASVYPAITGAFHDYFETRPRFGPDGQNLIDLLRAPALASPDSLAGQLAWIRDRWGTLLGDFLRRLTTALDMLQEEERAIWQHLHGARAGADTAPGPSGREAIPTFAVRDDEVEAFSPDAEWMPRTVLMAKSVYVWLHQLSVAHGRAITRLDEIPDAELDRLARRGFNALWLIGLWERSRASREIKQRMGNPDAAASAYSLYDYVIAKDLGGPSAHLALRERALARGIRLASDMVPNHMGIDSRWVIEHPDWFLALPDPPYPGYRFDSADLSSDGRVEIKIEDHYYDRTDAAVVFRRVDRGSGETRYIYHGNDGTSLPWNDTAQLDYLKAEVREGVIQTILHVARQFPVIRFDAAMTLARRHIQRLWFPEPGHGGAIPSRAEHAMTRAEFDAAMPREFWREVVDRVAAEAPGTLLLAEAFWLMEGYFVRTLGMHRVYNSAFMNMLRDEENANYRSVIKNTLEFDPEVLKRYVNFMSNPDERTAVEQFGKGDKYFGVCTLMATLPGLPMFGHGQIEGFGEKYGMEFRRPLQQESEDEWLIARHEREITPLLQRRALFAEAREFLLYDFFTDQGHVNEDVFVHSNRLGDERGLVVVNNRYAATRGWVRLSCAYAERGTDGHTHLRRRTLGEAFGLSSDPARLVAFRDARTGLEHLHRARDVVERGLRIELDAYQCFVFLDWREIDADPERPWVALCDRLAGRGVPSLDQTLEALEREPVHAALQQLLDPEVIARWSAGDDEGVAVAGVRIGALREQVERFAASPAGRRAGVVPVPAVDPSFDPAVASRLIAARALPERDLEDGPTREVLPIGEAAASPVVWGAVLAWTALAALGQAADPTAPDAAALRLFDRLGLREGIAHAMERLGAEDEEPWRIAARIRTGFAHPDAVPGPAEVADDAGWLRDPDAAWAAGAHEHDGARYLVREHYERLLWWLALPTLLAATAHGDPTPSRIATAIAGRLATAERAGWRLETLLAIEPRPLPA